MELEVNAAKLSLWSDIPRTHAAAWRRGRVLFGFSGAPPAPRGLLVGEAPGPRTDPKMPLFPAPNSSSGGRLLRYSGTYADRFLGRLVRVNLCDGPWSARRAAAGQARILTYLFDPANFYEGAPLRVLLLGARVPRAFGVVPPWTRAGFGHTELLNDGNPALSVAWIPHPSGKNLTYNDPGNQLRARRAVEWAIGERDVP